MRFGRIPLDEAEGAILAHAQSLGGSRRVKKGTVLGAPELAALRDAGVGSVIAARLAADDVSEDEAAARLGAALVSAGIEAGPATTGRVNLFARRAGLFLPERALVDALNALDPGITLATLREYEPVEAGRMVATVKIIPLAVPGEAVSAGLALLEAAPAFRLAPYRGRAVALVQTELPSVKASVLDKTRAVTEERLAASGSHVAAEARCAHDAAALAETLAWPEIAAAELVLVFGASAVIDPADVIPAAIEAAGGRVRQLGMPVDPGNLLLLAEMNGRPVLGAPGCARSPKENGFDWVLSRLLADLPVAPEDIRGMGVGGLLMEIAARPQPREADGAGAQAADVDMLVLAAGRSSRMGGPNKLLATFDGVPLVRRSVETALAAGRHRVRIVTGHRAEAVEAALAGLDVEILRNPDHAEGLSTSLRLGFAASARAGAAGVLVMLADQPLLTPADLSRLIEAFVPSGEGAIVVATDAGRRANPVILSAAFAGEIARLSGDVGARGIVAAHADLVREVELGRAAGLDVDTPDALRAAGGRLED